MTILKWALIMLVVSLVAALFGFTGLAAASADVARVLFYIFAVIFLVLLVLGFTIFRTASGLYLFRLARARPATSRTLRGAASQIAAAETKHVAKASQNPAL